ncbi:MAG: type VI secretion system Vgr family protein [Sandaracinaceae bacterium]
MNYRLDCDALGGIVPPLRYVRLVEALNLPYALRVDADIDDPGLDLATVVGADAVLEMRRGADAVRRVCGVVREVAEFDAHGGRTARLTILPALAHLGLVRNTRIFQDKTAPDILKEVLEAALGAYGRTVSQDLEGKYPTREYCVQYQETDLDFVHRVMEEEGIGYAFSHEGDKEELVLRDDNDSYPDASGGPAIPYLPVHAQQVDVQPVLRFERKHQPTSTKVTVRDWDWTKGGDLLVDGEEVGQGSDGRERESYEHGRGRSLSIWSYDQGARRYQKNDSADQPTTRLEAHRHEELRGSGVSVHLGMIPGARFELTGHPSPGADDRYLVTKVIHESRVVTDALDRPATGGTSDLYHNRFECIPNSTPYRPYRRTKKPVIASSQTAIVTGPSGEEIHVDEHGRARIQFHWDRQGAYDEKSTCWVRVQQPWAGAGWGFYWVPRIGMEVLVHFVDGDPDRPIVSSAVYNGSHPTPYALPDEKTKSTIKSDSSLGGGGFNEFRFEDEKGSEEIYTHAQKDYNEVVEHDHNTLVHHDQSNTVDRDQTQKVHRHQTEDVNANQRMTVEGNRTVTVHKDFEEEVLGTETRHTIGDVDETFSANETRTVTGAVTEDISGNETRTINGPQSETMSSTYEQSISGSSTETILGTLQEDVMAGITTTTPAVFEINAASMFSVTAPAGMKLTAPGGTLLLAPGGVSRVDSIMDWKGVQKMEVGGMEYALSGIKIGVVYFSLGFTGVKLEDTAITYANDGIKLWQELLGIEGPAIEMKMGAVEVESQQKVKT